MRILFIANILLLFPIFMQIGLIKSEIHTNLCWKKMKFFSLNFSQVNQIDDIEINKFKNIYIDYCGVNKNTNELSIRSLVLGP